MIADSPKRLRISVRATALELWLMLDAMRWYPSFLLLLRPKADLKELDLPAHSPEAEVGDE